MLAIDLVADLVREGKLKLEHPVQRTVTYHDPCRLNKRKGVHKAPRELLRAVPGLNFVDVDHVTQWSYCSGAGGGLAIEKPEITAELSRQAGAARGRSGGGHADQRLSVVRAAAVGSRAISRASR